MFQIPKIIQHRYSTVSNMRQYGQMLQKILLFYILFSLPSLFIFAFLFSLTHLFPLSSPCTGSLSLRPVRDVHWQRRRHSFDDNSVLRHAQSHPLLISPTLDLTHAQPRSISLISPRGRRQSHLLPSPLCPPFTLPLSGCGFFFLFFLLQFGLWAVVAGGGSVDLGGGGLWAMGGDSGSGGGMWG